MYIILLLLNLCNVLSASGNLPINFTREGHLVSENNRLVEMNNGLVQENNLLRYYLNQLAQKYNFIENENRNLKSLTSFNDQQIEQLRQESNQLRQENNQLRNNFLEKNKKVVFTSVDTNKPGSKFSSRKSRIDNSQKRSDSESIFAQPINNLFTAIHKKRMQEKSYEKK